ncbi:MAG TPA: hypothetical protein VGF17_06005 [Phytomonospora sp.]
MRQTEREKIVERMPFESRLGFVAFCVERCLAEARRHQPAREQLANLPWIEEGLAMLWARAEQGVSPDRERAEAIRAHLAGYESPDADGENVRYNYDVALVSCARELRNGLRIALDPEEADPDVVASAIDGPDQAVGAIYADWESSQAAEVELLDTALQRLKKLGRKPFSRAALADIPEWHRGALSPQYAEGRLTGTDVNRDL